tara:strand:+ start:1528 stop:7215 length:5688 start_codon:yes stop_codon:yes gene_type:complete
MSLDSQLNIQNLGFNFNNNDLGYFSVSSANSEKVAEFIGQNENATIHIKTPDTFNTNGTHHTFAIRSQERVLSISDETLNNDTSYTNSEAILEIANNGIFLNRDIYVKNVYPQQQNTFLLGSRTSRAKNIYTKKINVDNFVLFNDNGTLTTIDEEKKLITELGQQKPKKWLGVANHPQHTYLKGNLVINNDVIISGKIITQSQWDQWSIDNSKINLHTIGNGYSYTPETTPNTGDSLVTDAWRLVNGSNLYSSKSLVIDGDLYVSGGIQESNLEVLANRVVRYTVRDFTLADYAFSNIIDADYKGILVSNPIYVDGDIYVKGIIKDPVGLTFTTTIPTIPTETSRVNIKDRIDITNRQTIISNKDDIDIRTKNILLQGDVLVDGALNITTSNIGKINEVFEHSVAYNAMDIMQQRYAFAGQMRVEKGFEHEMGYHVSWITDANASHIFDIKGRVFMAGITQGSIRAYIEFILSINPEDNGVNLPGLDRRVLFNNTRTLFDFDELDLKVERKGVRHIKLIINWKTPNDNPLPLYNVSIKIEALPPAFLGKHMIFTPFYNQLDTDNTDNAETTLNDDITSLMESIAYANSNVVGNTFRSSEVPSGVVDQLYVGGGDIGPALVVEQNTLTKPYAIAEFWDKNSGDPINRHYTDDAMCALQHHGERYGVRIGADGVMGIGVGACDREHLDSPESAQVTIKNTVASKDIMRFTGRTQSSLMDYEGRLIIGNDQPLSIREGIKFPVINNYGLDVKGETRISGSISYAHNDVLNSHFSISKYTTEPQTSNIMDMYLSWGLDRYEQLLLNVQSIRMSVKYHISSTDIEDPQTMAQDFDFLITPHDNNKNYPNVITTWTHAQIKSLTFRNIEITNSRYDYNTVKISFQTNINPSIGAIYSSAYANIQVFGDNRLREFNLQTLESMLGLERQLTLPPINVKNTPVIPALPVAIGNYIYNVYLDYDISEAYFARDIAEYLIFDATIIGEHSNLPINISFTPELEMVVLAQQRGITYDINVSLRNIAYRIDTVNTDLVYTITELPPITVFDTTTPYAKENYIALDPSLTSTHPPYIIEIDEIIQGEYTYYLYHHYNLCNLYPLQEVNQDLQISTQDIITYTFIVNAEGLLETSSPSPSPSPSSIKLYRGRSYIFQNPDTDLYGDHSIRLTDVYIWGSVYNQYWFSYTSTSIIINIPNDFPNNALYYYCANHENMGIYTIEIEEPDNTYIKTDNTLSTLTISANTRGSTYDIQIYAYYNNDFDSSVNSNLIYRITEAQPIINNTTNIFVGDLIYNSNTVDLYSIFNKSQLNTDRYPFKFSVFDLDDSLSLDGSNLTIYGNLRGEDRTYKIGLEYLGYSQTLNSNIQLLVRELGPIIEKRTDYYIDNLILEKRELQLKDEYNINQYESDHIAFDFEIIDLEEGIDHSGIYIQNDSNLIIEGAKRGDRYDVCIFAFYREDRERTINNNLMIHVDEVAEIRRIETNYIYPIEVEYLVYEDITCNLWDYFKVAEEEDKALVEFKATVKSIDPIEGYCNLSGLVDTEYIKNDVEMSLSADLRGVEYEIQILARYKDYVEGNNSVSFKIKEAPYIESMTQKIIDVNDVILDNYTCNLIDYYNVKNYNQDIQDLVRFELINDENYAGVQLSGDGKSMEIQGAQRDITSNITIRAWYRGFKSQTSNVDVIFRITEPPEIEELGEYSSTTDIQQDPFITETTTFDMFQYFDISEENKDLVSFSVKNLTDEHTNVDFDNTNVNSNLVITGAQRGLSYNIEISAYYTKFKDQTVNSNVVLTVEEVSPIEDLSTSHYIYLGELVLETITCNLFDYYNVKSEHEYLVSFEYSNLSGNTNLDVEIMNTSNLVIVANQRGFAYDLQIKAWYTGYESTTINEDVIIRISECPEIECDVSPNGGT